MTSGGLKILDLFTIQLGDQELLYYNRLFPALLELVVRILPLDRKNGNNNCDTIMHHLASTGSTLIVGLSNPYGLFLHPHPGRCLLHGRLFFTSDSNSIPAGLPDISIVSVAAMAMMMMMVSESMPFLVASFMISLTSQPLTSCARILPINVRRAPSIGQAESSQGGPVPLCWPHCSDVVKETFGTNKDMFVVASALVSEKKMECT